MVVGKKGERWVRGGLQGTKKDSKETYCGKLREYCFLEVRKEGVKFWFLVIQEGGEGLGGDGMT